ncbi:Aldehyde/histidinol dehydrogenase [Amylocystis lapponica]|nr:Aldehyde/histidinol dehydrogenase [Amylocystis lapponica]
MTIPFTPLVIDGQDRHASTGKAFEVRNPHSGDVVGLAASASSEDCKDAVDAAARAFCTWEHVSISTRRAVFLKAASLLATERYAQKVKAALQEETAAVDSMVAFNLEQSTPSLAHIAGLVAQLKGETFPSDVPGGLVIAQRRACGVIFAIAPWNAPIYLTIRAVAIPIICGNTAVLKCSELSPRSQAIVVELLHEAGLPNGVLNFVAMPREDAPLRVAEIIAHPAVRRINVSSPRAAHPDPSARTLLTAHPQFTGSDTTGRLIAAEAAKHLKPCIFELGGKSPVIVLDDADVPRAARAIAHAVLMHSGQICMSTERVLVQRGAAPALAAALEAALGAARAGGPGAALSALVTPAAAANVAAMVAEARAAGARVVLGDGKADSAVVQPHLVAGVVPGMRMWERESFGPVVVLVEVASVDEAVELANATEYSLAAALWTQNVHTALDVAARIRAGCTSINGPTIHLELGRGLVGLGGASGYGHFDIDSFTDVRMVVVHPANPPPSSAE